MSIALFAIIGATIKPDVGYWIVFGFYCAVKALKFIIKIGEE